LRGELGEITGKGPVPGLQAVKDKPDVAGRRFRLGKRRTICQHYRVKQTDLGDVGLSNIPEEKYCANK
jgi:hypothetical protein